VEADISDLLLTNTYRVPFQFRSIVMQRVKIGSLAERSSGTRLQDPDGQ
jgi:hypothetical protein